MKKLLLFTCLFSAIIPVLLVYAFFAQQHDNLNSNQSPVTPLANKITDSGSFNLNHSSSVPANLTISPDLKLKPVPTNKWWENAVVANPFPEPLYNLPLSTIFSANGVGVGLPKNNVTSDVVLAPATADVQLKPDAQTVRSEVTDYDDNSVSLRILGANGQRIYDARLVKGVPFVFCNFQTALSINVASFKNQVIETTPDGRSVLRISNNFSSYVVYAPNAARMTLKDGVVSLRATDAVVVGTSPLNMSAKDRRSYDQAASAIVTATSVSYNVAKGIARTTLKYSTKNNQPTIVATLPHQTIAGNSATSTKLGELTTIRGKVELRLSQSIDYQTRLPTSEFIIKAPNNGNFYTPTKLKEYLTADAKNIQTNTSSYDGSKELYRLANLLMVAEQTKSSTAPVFRDRLTAELSDWLTYQPGKTNKYFYYDKIVKGLVAVEPQYGSDTFNDHHFHYGYFLYACAMLGTYNPQFVRDYGKTVNLIAADIAGDGDDVFPKNRTFDAYEGHSWAGGLQAFREGNNQESVSEAANAWFALGAWANVSANPKLKQKADWLYANEAAAANYYYYQNQQNPFPVGYTHAIVSLLWGGKNDSATWFSSTAEAKHMILTIPISGGSQYLNRSNELAGSLEALDAELNGAQPTSYQDILLLARSLTDPKTAQANFQSSLPLDNSNSLSYVYYYLAWAAQR